MRCSDCGWNMFIRRTMGELAHDGYFVGTEWIVNNTEVIQFGETTLWICSGTEDCQGHPVEVEHDHSLCEANYDVWNTWHCYHCGRLHSEPAPTPDGNHRWCFEPYPTEVKNDGTDRDGGER
jgi:hypothetical protein